MCCICLLRVCVLANPAICCLPPHSLLFVQGRAVLSNKYARMAFVGYALILHALIFLVSRRCAPRYFFFSRAKICLRSSPIEVQRGLIFTIISNPFRCHANSFHFVSLPLSLLLPLSIRSLPSSSLLLPCVPLNYFHFVSIPSSPSRCSTSTVTPLRRRWGLRNSATKCSLHPGPLATATAQHTTCILTVRTWPGRFFAQRQAHLVLDMRSRRFLAHCQAYLVLYMRVVDFNGVSPLSLSVDTSFCFFCLSFCN